MGRRSGISTDANVRASDAERNEVADRLSRHFSEGRLDQTEFKIRLDTAMSATTRGDLGGLFDDLPRLAAERPPPPPRHRRLLPFLVMVGLLAVAAGVSINTWPFVHIPWFLIIVVGFFFWHRGGRRRRHHHHPHHESQDAFGSRSVLEH
jgi:Flp pilus assembly protein TadB